MSEVFDEGTILRQLAKVGCASDYCVIRPGAQAGTNGTCGCLPDTMDPVLRLGLREVLWRWREIAMRAMRERDALRAIVAGRTTPPTDAEIHAHDARGGAWLVTLPPRAQVRMMPETRYTRDPVEVSRLWWSEGAWWVPVLHGRPYAWPTTLEPLPF